MVQEKYALEVVQKFGMADSKEVSTPFELGRNSGVEGGPQSLEERASMVGVPYTSRPDIAMGVSTFSHFCQDPRMAHWEAAKRLLRYIKGETCLHSPLMRN